jgi:hypothetical protein
MMRSLSTRQTAKPRTYSVVSILKKIGYGLLGLLAAALIIEFDATWEIVQELLITVVEVVEQEVEAFFAHTVGLTHYYAQMATAWLGFFLLLAFLIWLIRRIIRAARTARAELPTWREQKREAALSWWQRRTATLETWWMSLTMARKIATVITALMVAVPVSWALALLFATLVSVII